MAESKHPKVIFIKNYSNKVRGMIGHCSVAMANSLIKELGVAKKYEPGDEDIYKIQISDELNEEHNSGTEDELINKPKPKRKR